jgi:hypothetical protein
MTTPDRDQVLDLDRICEIAARLNEHAAMLRSLGLHEAAHLLEGAQADLDNRVYGNGHEVGISSATSFTQPRQPRRAKARQARAH